MRLLLGAGGHAAIEERKNMFISKMSDFLGGVKRVLFIPYALKDYDGYVRKIKELGLDAGRELMGIHEFENPLDGLTWAQAIFMGGGNTFRLLKMLQDQQIMPGIRECVQGGMPYIGVSAGTNVACPKISNTNDMPIVWPNSPGGLGLVPFQINTHFVSGKAYYEVDGQMVPYAGESREDRLREYHEENGQMVLAMREGAVLQVEGSTVTLDIAEARLFE